MGQKWRLVGGAQVFSWQGSRSGSRKVTKSAPCKQDTVWSCRVGWEAPATPPVTEGGLRKKSAARCCQGLWFMSYYKPKEEEGFTRSYSQLPHQAAPWGSAQMGHIPVWPWSSHSIVFQMGGLEGLPDREGWAETDRGKEKGIKCVSLKMDLATKMPKCMTKPNAKKR